MWPVFRMKSECAQGPPPKEDKLVLDLHVTAASVGKATIQEDNIKSRGRCVGLHGLALMLIRVGDRFGNKTHTWTDCNKKDAQILGDNKVLQI